MYHKKVDNDINLILRIQTKEDLPHKVWIRTVSIFTILASNDKSPIIQHGLQKTYQQECHEWQVPYDKIIPMYGPTIDQRSCDLFSSYIQYRHVEMFNQSDRHPNQLD